MSDSFKITLDKNQYNTLFGLCSTFKGEKSKLIGTKVMDLIREKVMADTKDDVNPESITVDILKKYLDGVYIGMTEVIKTPEISTNDVFNLKVIAQVLKMKTRFENLIDKEIAEIPENEIEFDGELLDEPFDGE